MWNEINWFSNMRSIIELVYFIATVIMAGAACYALKQISTAKEINKTNCQRDAYKIAAEQCSFFKNELLNSYNELTDKVNASGCKIFDNTKVIKENGKLKMIVNHASKKELEEAVNFKNDFVELNNNLESLAVYFINRIGDDEIGFNTIGEAYCGIIEKYFFLICLSKSYKRRAYFRLYIKWANCLEEQRKQDEISSLEKKVKELKKDKKSTSFEMPLGADD